MRIESERGDAVAATPKPSAAPTRTKQQAVTGTPAAPSASTTGFTGRGDATEQFDGIALAARKASSAKSIAARPTDTAATPKQAPTTGAGSTNALTKGERDDRDRLDLPAIPTAGQDGRTKRGIRSHNIRTRRDTAIKGIKNDIAGLEREQHALSGVRSLPGAAKLLGGRFQREEIQRAIQQKREELKAERALNLATKVTFRLGGDTNLVAALDSSASLEVANDEHLRADAAYDPKSKTRKVGTDVIGQLDAARERLVSLGIVNEDGDVLDAARLDQSSTVDAVIQKSTLIATHEQEHLLQDKAGVIAKADQVVEKIVEGASKTPAALRDLPQADRASLRDSTLSTQVEAEMARIKMVEVPAYRKQEIAQRELGAITKTHLTIDQQGIPLPLEQAAENVFEFQLGMPPVHGTSATGTAVAGASGEAAGNTIADSTAGAKAASGEHPLLSMLNGASLRSLFAPPGAVNESSTDDNTATGREIDGKFVPGSDVNGKFVPGKFVPGDDVNGKFVPGKFVPGQMIDGKFVPGRNIDGKFVPGKFVPGNDVNGKFVPGDEVNGKFVPGSDVNGKFVPGKFVPGDEVNGKFVPGKFVPGNDVNGKFVPGDEVNGKFVPGKFVPGKFIDGKFVPGKFVPGKFIDGKFVPGHMIDGKFVPGHLID